MTMRQEKCVSSQIIFHILEIVNSDITVLDVRHFEFYVFLLKLRKLKMDQNIYTIKSENKFLMIK